MSKLCSCCDNLSKRNSGRFFIQLEGANPRKFEWNGRVSILSISTRMLRPLLPLSLSLTLSLSLCLSLSHTHTYFFFLFPRRNPRYETTDSKSPIRNHRSKRQKLSMFSLKKVCCWLGLNPGSFCPQESLLSIRPC
jgi:hypothetical protein